MTGFPINPPRTPLVDDAGIVTPEWYKFFVEIQAMIGGPSDPFEDAYFLATAPDALDAVSPGDGELTPPAQPQPVMDALIPPPAAYPPSDNLIPAPPVPVPPDDLAPYARHFAADGVHSPWSTNDNSVPRYDGTAGNIIQGSGVYIDDSGFMGVGTASPARRLHVVATAAISVATLESTFGANAALAFKDTTTTVTPQIVSSGNDLYFQAGGNARFWIRADGNVYTDAGSTTMSNGFFYIPAAAGVPTGAPTAITGTVPMYYDTTNNHFYVYNGAWKKVALA